MAPIQDIALNLAPVFVLEKRSNKRGLAVARKVFFIDEINRKGSDQTAIFLGFLRNFDFLLIQSCTLNCEEREQYYLPFNPCRIACTVQFV